MSRGIRKARRRTPYGEDYVPPQFRYEGLSVFFTGADCIVAKTPTEARDLLCRTIYGMAYSRLKPSSQEIIKELRFEPILPSRVISYWASQAPGWEPESEDEEEDPPRIARSGSEMIDDFGKGVVFCEM